MNSGRQNPSRILELDGIRGLAISLVLYEHFVGRSLTGTSWQVNFLQHLRFFGGSGVDLFFVLSGFLIGGILMDNREAPHYFKSFYVRRCCRILPVYLFVLGGGVAVKFLLAAHAGEPWFTQLFLVGGMPSWAYLIFAQNIVKAMTYQVNAEWMIVTWTLVVEEQFYLALPFAIWLLRPSHVIKIVLAFTLLNPVFQLYLCIWHPVAHEAVANVMPLAGDALLVGVICAYLIRQERYRSWLAQNWQVVRAILIILLLGLICVMPFTSQAAYEYERILFLSLWLALFYGVFLLVAVTGREGIVAAAMRLPFLRRLGTISYAVYLFHMPVNGLMHGLLLGSPPEFHKPADLLVSLAALGITLILATASWHFFEKPIIGSGHMVLYGRPKTIQLKRI